MELALYLIGGFILLIAGGEIVVKGGVALAKNLGLPKALIGLTILAYGTSAPELVISLESALAGHADMALGNVIGSNISNILLVLGGTALLSPLMMDRSLLKPDGIAMFAMAALLVIFALGGTISRVEGIIFAILCIGYTLYVFRKGKLEGYEAMEEEVEAEMNTDLPLPRSILYVALGLGCMVGGGKLLVTGGVGLAEMLGVSGGVIGLTIIAVGTSLPELATSLAAARRGHADMAIANVLGSNLLNIFGIVGITATVLPLSVDPAFLRFDLWLLLALSALLVLALALQLTLKRLPAIIGLLGFFGYILYQYQTVLV
jgi:cation:H+ antiporter